MSDAETRRGGSYVYGCGLVLLSGLVLSLGVLCIRGAGNVDAFQYLMWRAVGFTVAVAAIAAYRQRLSPLVQLRRMHGFGWLAAAAMVASQVGFVTAVKLTTVAEVFFLLSLAPLLAAVIAYPLLGERIGALGAIAVVVALAGVALMTGGGLQSGEGVSWAGRLWALVGAVGYAIYTLAIRGARREDLDAALVATGLLTALVGLSVTLATGKTALPPWPDLGLALLHGGVVLSLGLVLMARGSRNVTAMTMIMLAQSESIVAPILTYLVFGETTTLGVVAGGALILLAVVLQGVDGARQTSPSPADAPSVLRRKT